MPEAYTTFFSVSAGAGATLLGLIFVAVSISPERTVGKDAPIERAMQAESAFSALINAFFVSLVALTPTGGAGWGGLAFSIFGFQSSLRSIFKIFRETQGWLNITRHLFLVIASFIIYCIEFYISLELLQSPNNIDALASLTSLICGIYGVGIVRAWELFGVDREFFLRLFSLIEYLRTKLNTEAKKEPEKEQTAKETSISSSETDKAS